MAGSPGALGSAGVVECVIASCTTGKGAWIDYQLKRTLETTAASSEETIAADSTEQTLVIVPQTGTETWSRLELRFGLDRIETTQSSDRGWELHRTKSFDATWTGSLRPDWPQDSAVSGTLTSSSASSNGIPYHLGEEDEFQVSSAACDLGYSAATGVDDWDQPEPYWHKTLTLNGDTLAVRNRPANGSPVFLATLNGTCLAEVDEAHQIIGSCDLSHDDSGWRQGSDVCCRVPDENAETECESEEMLWCAIYATCLNPSYVCDGNANCSDGSDEEPAICETFCQNRAYFWCGGGGRCLDSIRVCDGNSNCSDGSDEEPAMCEPLCQDEGHFWCAADARCVVSHQVCDGDANCSDGSDESGC